jgi:hypothetical protein
LKIPRFGKPLKNGRKPLNNGGIKKKIENPSKMAGGVSKIPKKNKNKQIGVIKFLPPFPTLLFINY